MGRDELGTLARLKAHRTERLDPIIARHGGRVVKLTGDGALVEFGSAVDALTAAIEIQHGMAEANRDQPDQTRIAFRIGLHLGDLVVDGDDLYGDSVNVAARLEAEAPAGGIVISGNLHDAVVGRLEALFEDLGALSLKNIERPVRAYRAQGPSSAPPSLVPARAHVAGAPLVLPDKPSIAVLPFQNMSGDPEQEYFADGIVEDIITALSRFKSLFVIARNSSFTYKGKAVDIKHVGRELGVRYVLEGSVRKAASRIRITGQLIDSSSGAHLWADRFDGAMEDIFDVQDRVTVNVVGAIVPKLDQAETERAKRKPVESLDAYDCYLRGMASREEGTKEGEDEALRLFYRAIELDPNFATPYGMAAGRYLIRRGAGRVENKEWEQAETRRLATRVSVIGSDDAVALAMAGGALVYVCQDYETGSAMIDRALAINPNIVFGQRQRGWTSIFLGRHDDALKAFAYALRLSPLDPRIGEAERGMASALTFLGRHEEAAAWADKAYAHQPNDLATMRVSAVALAWAGNVEEAQRIAARLCQQIPALRVSRIKDYIPHRRSIDIELFAEGLRRAGVPE